MNAPSLTKLLVFCCVMLWQAYWISQICTYYPISGTIVTQANHAFSAFKKIRSTSSSTMSIWLNSCTCITNLGFLSRWMLDLQWSRLKLDGVSTTRESESVTFKLYIFSTFCLLLWLSDFPGNLGFPSLTSCSASLDVPTFFWNGYKVEGNTTRTPVGKRTRAWKWLCY